MRLSKLARFLGLAVIIAAISLPAFATPPCSCELCLSADPFEPCGAGRPTTCGRFLMVALCPAN